MVCGKKEANLRVLLSKLAGFGIISVLVEGGATVARAAISEKQADMALVAVSGKKITGKNALPSPFTKKMLAGFARKKLGADSVYQKSLLT